MSNHITNFISACETCLIFQKSKQKEPLILSEMPNFPFQITGMDIAEDNNKIFLAVEDYYSRWLEIIPLLNKTSTEIINKLKILFSTHGTPEMERCDNNPFSSMEMTKFAHDWGFTIRTSSPHYSKSNGLSEKGV